jgi:hypothetical protein
MKNLYLFLFVLLAFNFAAISQSKVSVSWDLTHGEDGEEVARSIINSQKGGYFVVGYTDSKGNGKKDGWLLKLNNEAQLEWDLTFGGPDDDEFYDILETEEGNLAIVGYTSSQGSGKEDYWFILTDENGDALYSKTFGGDKTDIATNVIQNFSGDFIISGRTESFGPGKSNQYILKIKPNLEKKEEEKPGASRRTERPVWTRYNGGNGFEEAGKLFQHPKDSLIYVVGNSTAYSNGAMDAYFITLDDELGRVKDRQNYGGKQFDRANDFIMNEDGSFMFFGATRTNSVGLYDGWVSFIFKDEFYQEWEKSYGYIKEDIFVSAVKNESNYLIAGITESKGEGNFDAWLFMIDMKGEKLLDTKKTTK